MIYQELFKNKLFRGGSVFFIGGVIANVLNYFYRILMGRMLGPELFGELIAIISLILIFLSGYSFSLFKYGMKHPLNVIKDSNKIDI